MFPWNGRPLQTLKSPPVGLKPWNSSPDESIAHNGFQLTFPPVDRLWVYTAYHMATRNGHPLEGEMLQGTLDLLILQTLVLGPAHGHSIAHAIERRSEDVLQVEHGSLYPALHRLEDRAWIASFWGTSENNRKARYYRLTPKGRKQLIQQTGRWDQLVRAINRVLKPAME